MRGLLASLVKGCWNNIVIEPFIACAKTELLKGRLKEARLNRGWTLSNSAEADWSDEQGKDLHFLRTKAGEGQEHCFHMPELR